jgi:hypothetical protein
MEANQTEQNVSSGVSSPEVSEIKSSISLSRRTEPSLSQGSGAIAKAATKSRTGGVKLGSFRLGGRRKVNSEGDSSIEVKEEKRKSKKYKKETTNDKPESEDSAASTPSPATKQSIPSRASSLVRKLSIGKYRASGSGASLKSPDTPSSQEECQSASTEEDCFFSASPSSAATDGRPSLEGIISATPTQNVASPVHQSTADTKVSKSDSSIGDCTHSNGVSVTQTMSEMDNLPNPESKDGTPEVVKREEKGKVNSEVAAPKLAADPDVKDLAEIRKHVSESDQTEEVSPADANGDMLPTSYCTPVDVSEISPLSTTLPVKGDKISKYEWWFTNACENDESPEQDTDRKPTTRDQILSITTPLLMKQRQQVEEYFKLIGSETLPSVPNDQQLPDFDDDDFRDPNVETEPRSPSPDVDTEVKLFEKLGISVSVYLAFCVPCNGVRL